MTPTQAQIDAALKAYHTTKADDPEQAMRAALTAAAEAGEGYPLTDPLLRVTLNATIERCAQVAEDYPDTSYKIHNGIAAAIRALKDKP